ncbi:site-specific DNA-methyltransferase [Tenacibaculum ovolyticum]|uniref:site-specific DNA-methyltransferase n=1 Tax=Tenacibaculum ovolyticum TaxID=104270 RepID=UPI0007EC4E45|nr:site-specific DNA-methyltransferase [Tenacibaculum ovolyticum]
MPLLNKDKDSKTNLIIKGDNIKILKKILPDFNKKVKCIYIDPPYNNGESYNHYDDDYTHQAWLDEMTETLSNLKPFLTDDGSIWISIDDSEMHYLKIAADKVFGRHNFVTTIIWQQRTTRENRSVFSNNHEYILVYCVNQIEFKKSRNLLPVTEEILKRYKNPDNDPRGVWQSVSANVQDGHAVLSQYYDIIAPNGKIHSAPNGRCWCYNKERMDNEILNNNIWFGKDGNGVPRIKKFLNGKSRGLTPETLWLGKIAGTNKSAKKHFLQMFPNEKVFDTPKPEELIKLIFEIATNENDIVLDCYLGSGTTISTAHKMKRQYIGIEKGDHITDIVLERMNLVINGEQGGISQSINWVGGGSFTFKKNYKSKLKLTL